MRWAKQALFHPVDHSQLYHKHKHQDSGGQTLGAAYFMIISIAFAVFNRELLGKYGPATT